MIVLGIETSCDETAVGIVADGNRVLANVISTQVDVHKKFGGVVPEVAARHHMESIIPVLETALERVAISIRDLDAIAVTSAHGLVGCLAVGVAVAKSLSYSLELPLIGVHHVEGHIYATYIENPDLRPPFLCLTVSGGHTLLIQVQDEWQYKVLGETLDDSAGEAFDKIARLMGLGFPGGPLIDRLSRQGDPRAFNFPRPLRNSKSYNFSFSGLKTAVKNTIQLMQTELPGLSLYNLAASVQEAIVEVLVQKTLRAAADTGIHIVTVTGGVAANFRLRHLFKQISEQHGFIIIFPSPSLCTDNGAMIACAGYYRLLTGKTAALDLDVKASAPVGDAS